MLGLGLKKNLKLVLSINWVKTLYFNFKMFPFSIAKKLPVFFYGYVKFSSLTGEIIFKVPVTSGMVGIGQTYEMMTRSKRIAEILLDGTLIIRGNIQFGKDIFIYLEKNAELDLGNMVGVASGSKIICTNKVVLGDYARVGSECQIIDTDFHFMINTITGEQQAISKPIIMGSYNYVGRWSSIMKNTITPDYCTIASNTLCNKDYREYGKNILLGGIPAKLLKKNISRDWEREEQMLLNLALANKFKTTKGTH